MAIERVVLGGGCFWCLEAVFQRIPGVKSVASGYSGGHVKNPSYRDVCNGTTGHAEVVQIEFDSAVVSLDKIFESFWHCHDPTTLNRQGGDTGTQYRSCIHFADDAQKKSAIASRETAQKEFKNPIVTEITKLDVFYPAEDYHQNYYNDNKAAGYCQFVIRPKLEKMGMQV